jgi:hypothetical protein
MKALSAELHESLIEGLGMIPDDLFQIFTLHDSEELVFSRTFPGADRDDIIFVQILSGFGYSPAQKQAMYAQMVSRLTKLGIPQDVLLVSIVEIDGANNWHSPGHPAADSAATA